MGVSLYTSRVVLNTLGVDDFGIYGVVGGIIAMFGFLNSSMSGATSRFLTFELGRQDYERLKKTFSAALTIHFIIALLILVLGETAGLWCLENKLVIAPDRMNAARWVFHLSVLASVINITQVPYNATIIAHERMNVYAYVAILNSLLKLGIVYLLIIGNFDKLILYAVLTLCVTIVITAIYKIYCARNFVESHYKFHWDKKIIKPMISFSGWNLYQSSSYTLRTQGINMILNMFYGVALNAAYGIANQVQTAVNSLSENFLMAVSPQIIKYYANRDFSKMQSLVINASKFTCLLLFMMSLPLTLETNFIMQLWLKNVPDYAVAFSQLFIIFKFISLSTNPASTVILATGRVKIWSLVAGTLFLLVIPITYFLLKAGYSPIVPMIANVIMISLCGVLKFFIVKRLVPEFSIKEYFLKFVVVVGIIAVLSSIFPVWIHYIFQEGFLRLFLVVGSFILILSLMTYYIALNRQMRKKLLLKIKKVF
jgi:O-antigen/teichoic acid export membrane protein